MKERSEKILIAVGALASVICVLFTAIVILAAIWKFAPNDQALTAIKAEDHAAVQLTDGSIEVFRYFNISRDVELVFSRELSKQKPNGTIIRIELPTSRVSYTKGSHKIGRILHIPTIPPGDYKLHVRACWEQNPVRINCVDLPAVDVNIK